MDIYSIPNPEKDFTTESVFIALTLAKEKARLMKSRLLKTPKVSVYLNGQPFREVNSKGEVTLSIV